MEAQFSYPHAPESSCVRATFSDSAMFPSEHVDEAEVEGLHTTAGDK